MGNSQQQENKESQTSSQVNDGETYEINQDIKQKAYETEVKLLSEYAKPLTHNEIYYKDISIDFHGNNYLHTLMCGHARPGKDIIVCLHGYQGNSLTFYKLMPLLYDNYTTYAPDIIGMGLSSRPKVEFTSTEMCNDYFIESLEAWRKVMNIDKFYMCGHSLGGYFALIYALRFPEHIKDIILMAPTCISDVSKGGDIHHTVWWPQKIGFRLVSPLWSFQPRLQDLVNNKLLTGIFNMVLRKRYDISPEESEYTGLITELTMKYPKDTDQCIYYIFKHPFPSPQKPLEGDLENKLLDKHFLVMYGEKDWMERVGIERLAKKYPERFDLFTVSKYGHTFPMENPSEVAEIINTYLKPQKYS